MWRGWDKREGRKIRELTGIEFSLAWLVAGRKIFTVANIKQNSGQCGGVDSRWDEVEWGKYLRDFIFCLINRNCSEAVKNL